MKEHTEHVERVVAATGAKRHEVAARFERIAADPEMRETFRYVQEQMSDTLVTNVTRGAEGTLEVSVAPADVEHISGKSKEEAVARAMKRFEHAQRRMRAETAKFELERTFGRARTAMPLLGLFPSALGPSPIVFQKPRAGLP